MSGKIICVKHTTQIFALKRCLLNFPAALAVWQTSSEFVLRAVWEFSARVYAIFQIRIQIACRYSQIPTMFRCCRLNNTLISGFDGACSRRFISKVRNQIACRFPNFQPYSLALKYRLMAVWWLLLAWKEPRESASVMSYDEPLLSDNRWYQLDEWFLVTVVTTFAHKR